MLAIKVLDQKLGKNRFDVLRVIVVTELWCEKHLANAFDCDLTQDTVIYHQIIAG